MVNNRMRAVMDDIKISNNYIKKVIILEKNVMNEQNYIIDWVQSKDNDRIIKDVLTLSENDGRKSVVDYTLSEINLIIL